MSGFNIFRENHRQFGMAFCEMNFEDNSDNVFHAGQIVRGNDQIPSVSYAKKFYDTTFISGTVRLVLPERKEVRGVYIKFKGDAFAAWKEDLNYESSEKLLRYTQYFARGNFGMN